MMTKCNSGETARVIASERHASFSWSVFNGAWYVGTPEQLQKIGCVDIGTPAPCVGASTFDGAQSICRVCGKVLS